MRIVIYAAFVAILLGLLTAPSCGGKVTPEGQRGVMEATKIPGMAESLEVKDRAIRIAIVTSINMDVELKQQKIEIEVNKAKVILSGMVSKEEFKERAEQYARDTEGVLDVLNKIEVDETMQDEQFLLDDI